MFKIYKYNGYLEEGTPYIISTVVRAGGDDYLEWFVLVIKTDKETEPVLLQNKMRYCYKKQSKLLEEHFQPQQLLQTQFSFAKSSFWCWLYQQRESNYFYEQKQDWEELEVNDIIMPFAVMSNYNHHLFEKISAIVDSTSCSELEKLLGSIQGLKMSIEKIDGEQE